MSMTLQHIKEQISKAYVNAIAANAGILFKDNGNLDYGMDGKFSDVDVYLDNSNHCRFSENGFGIDIQLKATVNAQVKNGKILYDLEMKNYLDLIRTDIGTPRILIIYSLPKEREKWIEIHQDKTIVQKCAWWCSLRGEPHKVNKSKIRIAIPENQMLTSDELKNLIERVRGGEFL